jgi:hypothetical protein
MISSREVLLKVLQYLDNGGKTYLNEKYTEFNQACFDEINSALEAFNINETDVNQLEIFKLLVSEISNGVL